MKTTLTTIAVILMTALHSHAEITMAWEYQFDGASVGQPTLDFSIHETYVSPSGYIAVEVQAMGMEPGQVEQRIVLLDPEGNTTWTSSNLITDPMMASFETIQFTHASNDALSFLTTGTGSGPYTYYMYNANHGPSLASKHLSEDMMSGEAIESLDPMMGTSGKSQSTYNATSFFTLVADPMSMGNSALRKYTLDVVSSSKVVAQTVAGTSGNNFQMGWSSSINTQYQIEESTDLTTWTPIGGVLTGTGASMSWSAPISSSQQFYRVIQL